MSFFKKDLAAKELRRKKKNLVLEHKFKTCLP